jgi:DnaK suppressor protein
MTNPIARKLLKELATTLKQLRHVDGAQTGGDLPSLSSDNSTDLVDRAQEGEQRELGHLTATRLVDRARRLRVALARVERGEYGVCEECGEEIGSRRLAALPDVVTCVDCQERRERPPHVSVR